MANHTGENEQGLRKIIDLTRMLSIAILLIHIYLTCYNAFEIWGFTNTFIDSIVMNFSKMGLFNSNLTSLTFALSLLSISLLGAKGKKDEKIDKRMALSFIFFGLIFYYSSQLFLLLNADIQIIASSYIGSLSLGYLLILSGGTRLSR